VHSSLWISGVNHRTCRISVARMMKVQLNCECRKAQPSSSIWKGFSHHTRKCPRTVFYSYTPGSISRGEYQPNHRKALVLTTTGKCAITMDTRFLSHLPCEWYRHKESAVLMVNLEQSEGATGGHLSRFRVFIALSLRVVSQQKGATHPCSKGHATVDLEEAATPKIENS
jgi:hypothetical protein